jgi:hypothetical protein
MTGHAKNESRRHFLIAPSTAVILKYFTSYLIKAEAEKTNVA